MLTTRIASHAESRHAKSEDGEMSLHGPSKDHAKKSLSSALAVLALTSLLLPATKLRRRLIKVGVVGF